MPPIRTEFGRAAAAVQTTPTPCFDSATLPYDALGARDADISTPATTEAKPPRRSLLSLIKPAFISVAATCLLAVPQVAAAQVVILPGALLLAGYRATCGPVDTMIQPINDIAAAGQGRIYLHPRVFDLPRAQQLFWYTHECAHQIFGPGEAAADCWAVQQGRIQGWLSRDEFDKLKRSMRNFLADATHQTGATRITYMDKCYAN